MTTITKQCECGTTFEAPEDPEWSFLTPDSCPACTEKRFAEREREQEKIAEQNRANHLALLLQKLDEMTPDRLRTPNIDHPSFNRDLWRKVSAWEPTRERPWLGIIGETGACKTRCAFLRLRQFLTAEIAEWGGYKDAPKFGTVVITGMDFNRYAVEQYSKAKGEPNWLGKSESEGGIASRRLRQARTADLLLFDELGKVRSSAGTIDELFALIDHRTSRNLVTIWTSNTPPERFCTSWPEEYASPGCGRIIEASTVINA